MASLLCTFFVIFFLYCGIYPATSDATVSANVDNIGTISLSRDGVSYTQIGYETNWNVQTVINIPETDITPSSIIKFECVDAGGVGGFIANINYNNVDYYTTNPMAASLFELISSTDSITSPLSYTANGASPWGNAAAANVPANAYWVWNGQVGNTIVFHFKFATIATTTTTVTPTKYPSSNPNPSPSSNPSSGHATGTKPPSLDPTAPTTVSPSPVPTPAPVGESQVEEDTTTGSPESNESNERGDNMTAGTPDEMLMAILVSTGVFLLLCCICVFLVYTVVKQKKKAEREAIFGQQTLDDDKEYYAESQPNQNAQNAEDTVEGVSVDPQVQNAQNSALPNANNVGVFEENPAPPQVVAVDAQPAAAQGVCTDCGLMKAGTVYEADGLFYCNQCWKAYE